MFNSSALRAAPAEQALHRMNVSHTKRHPPRPLARLAASASDCSVACAPGLRQLDPRCHLPRCRWEPAAAAQHAS